MEPELRIFRELIIISTSFEFRLEDFVDFLEIFGGLVLTLGAALSKASQSVDDTGLKSVESYVFSCIFEQFIENVWYFHKN